MKTNTFFLAILMLWSAFCYAQDEDKTEPTDSEHQIIATQLGWGYDINGRFCHEDAFIRPVLRITDKSDYTFTRSLGFEGVRKEGRSASEFANKLAASAGVSYSGAAFSGELEMEYGYSKSSKKERSYLLDQRSITRFRVRVLDDRMGELLIPEVKEAIDSLDPKLVIKRYGAFVAQDLYYGAKLSFRSSAENKESTRNESIDARAVAGGWGVQAKGSISKELNSLESELAKSVSLKAYGGDAGLLTQANFSDEKFDEWQSTIRSGNIALAHLGSRAFKPIWEFASTPQRRKALKDAAVALYPKMTANKVASKPKPPASPISLKSHKPGQASFCAITLDRHKEYISSADGGHEAYYPRVGGKPAELHIYSKREDATELQNGDTVEIAYIGNDENDDANRNAWPAKWKNYCWLYVTTNANSNSVYCWSRGADNAKWTIYKRGVDATSKDVIREGDAVRFVNSYYKEHNLFKGSQYTEVSTSEQFWTIKRWK